MHTFTITLRLQAHVNTKCVHVTVKQLYHVIFLAPNLHAVMIFWVQELTTRTSVELCNQTHLYLSRHTPSGQVAYDSQTCAHIDAKEPHAGLQRKFTNLVVKAFGR